jgi:hydroxymethylbilane synthase
MNGTGATVRIGSRGSPLALWQANWVRDQLAARFPGLGVELEIIKTTGDKILDSPLSKIGDKGLFTREIEHALLERRIDLAVHSLKDLPTELPAGLAIGAVTQREDVHDVFIARAGTEAKKLDDIPRGGTIATGSLRRRSQLLHWRPDLTIVENRGNLNTRLSKLDDSTWDGMILARAGVVRLGWDERITEVIPLERILPAVGQGALAIEFRAGDSVTLKFIAPLASAGATSSTLGERAFLRELEGGCQVPIGAFGRIEENVFRMDAMIGSLDGKKYLRGKIHGDPGQSERLGTELAKMLYESGGDKILEEIRQ